MSNIRIAVEIDATPEQVWAELQQIERHVEWMHDAVAIHFVNEQTSGVGTNFLCDTKIGPFKLVDRMTITEWVPAAAMGVRHTGIVTGEGQFTLQGVAAGTHFAWQEQLRFPWWLGGRLGEQVGAPVLRLIWKRNLRKLRRRFD